MIIHNTPENLRAFLAFAKTKRANDVYVWGDASNCPLAQWAQSLDEPYCNTPLQFERFTHGGISEHDMTHHTWGMLVMRIEQELGR